MSDTSSFDRPEQRLSEGRDEIAQPLIVALICGVSVAIGGQYFLRALRRLLLLSASNPSHSYLIELCVASCLLAVSGLGLWWRWPWSRQLNLVATSAVAFLLNANYLDGVLWAIPGAVLLVQPSVNAFWNGTIVRHYGAEETLTPRSLRAFLLIFFTLCILAVFTKPFS